MPATVFATGVGAAMIARLSSANHNRAPSKAVIFLAIGVCLTMSATTPSSGIDVAALAKKLPKAALEVLLLVVAPALIGGWVGGSAGATGLVIGVLGGFLGSLGLGTRTMRQNLPLIAGALALGGLAAGTWWWVALAAVIGVAAGWMSQFSLLHIYSIAGIVAVTAKPNDSWQSAAISFALVLVGGVCGLMLAQRAGAALDNPVPATAPPTARLLALLIGIGAFVACALALQSGERGYWIPMTLFILIQPVQEGRANRGWHRLAGTLAGFAICVPLAWLDLPGAVVAGLTIMSLLLVVVIESPYWLRSLFTTVSVVLALAPRSDLIGFAGMRLAETLIGVAIVLMGAAVVVLVERRTAARTDQPAGRDNPR